MSEEKKKEIPIEDGSKKDETVPQEEVKEEKVAGEAEIGKNAGEDAEKLSEEQAEGAEESAEETREDNAEETADATEDEASEEKSDEKPEEDAETAESERYMRLMAEFQNFKRRAAKEKTDIHAFANERIVSDLLPVLDNFERALGTDAGGKSAEETGEAAGSEEFSNYVKGMELIFEQLKTALDKAGVKEIAALGEEFDPSLHNAVMTEQSDEYEDGKISKVLQKGYTLNEKVVRPAMVAVVRN